MRTWLALVATFEAFAVCDREFAVLLSTRIAVDSAIRTLPARPLHPMDCDVNMGAVPRDDIIVDLDT